MACAYISDGYTVKGYIEGRPRLYESLRFSYRPLLLTERAEFSERNVGKKVREQNYNIAKLLEERIVEWDLKKPIKNSDAAEPVPAKSAEILRLNPVLFDRLFGIVCGTEAYDDDPQVFEAKPEEAADAKN